MPARDPSELLARQITDFARELMCSHSTYATQLRAGSNHRHQNYRTKVGSYLTQLRQGTPGDACARAPFDETQHFVPREASRPAYEEVRRPSGL